MRRSFGILTPIFSLPSQYGIGSFGKEAYDFVDFLSENNVKYWQMLPLVQTGYGDSPYQTICDNSFNPYFISLENLYNKGLISKTDLKSSKVKGKYIDYGKLYNTRFKILRKAFNNFNFDDDFINFVNKKEYDDYALFMALKNKFNCQFNEFKEEYKNRDKKALQKFKEDNIFDYLFYVFIQYEAKYEFTKLKEYANSKDVKIIGDLPLYVAYDSVEVWKNPENFLLDENLTPKKVAGVPPDYFCSDGQLWGNPIYDFEKMKETNFKWWKSRINNALKIYDIVRIDHFRGLDRYWEIPYGEVAKNGCWQKSYGYEILKNFSKNRIIAEDLGDIDDGVRELLKTLDLKGMKVLTFAFDGNDNNAYLPKNVIKNCVYYTGTHDNDTVKGLLKKLPKEQFNFIKNKVRAILKDLNINVKVNGLDSLVEAFNLIAIASKSDLAIIPLHDILRLDNRYRINEPGTVGNWQVKYTNKLLQSLNGSNLKSVLKQYKR